MLYDEKDIEQETIEHYAKICLEVGTPAEVMLDYSDQDLTDYYTVMVDESRTFSFEQSKNAEDLADAINDYVTVLKGQEDLK
ncbi:hypothetical protein [Priestia aryabhattai]